MVCTYQAIRWSSWPLVLVPQLLVFYNSWALNIYLVEIMLVTRLYLSYWLCCWQICILCRSSTWLEKADVLIFGGGSWVITEKLQLRGRMGWDWTLGTEWGEKQWSEKRRGQRWKLPALPGYSHAEGKLVLLEWCLFIWKEAVWHERFTKQELL